MAGISGITGDAGSKLAVLEEYLGSLKKAAVAFSGGVDSAFLLKVAHNILGSNVIAVTAKPYSFPERELEETKAFCKETGIQHFICKVDELGIDGFSKTRQTGVICVKRNYLERLRK